MHLRPTCALTLTFFPGKPEGADGEDMETGSHVDTQVSHSTSSLSVFVRLLFYFLVFFFFGGNKQVAHLAWHTSLTTDGRIKRGSRISLTYLQHSRWCSQCDRFQWVPGASAIGRRRTQICAKRKSNGHNFNHFPCKYESSYWSTLQSWTQLNFAGKPAVNAWDR